VLLQMPACHAGIRRRSPCSTSRRRCVQPQSHFRKTCRCSLPTKVSQQLDTRWLAESTLVRLGSCSQNTTASHPLVGSPSPSCRHRHRNHHWPHHRITTTTTSIATTILETTIIVERSSHRLRQATVPSLAQRQMAVPHLQGEVLQSVQSLLRSLMVVPH
jgi:hypothetical protein